MSEHKAIEPVEGLVSAADIAHLLEIYPRQAAIDAISTAQLMQFEMNARAAGLPAPMFSVFTAKINKQHVLVKALASGLLRRASHRENHPQEPESGHRDLDPMEQEMWNQIYPPGPDLHQQVYACRVNTYPVVYPD